MSKYVIIAPRVGDEILGCFSILQQSNVYAVFYLHDYNGIEHYAATRSATRFNFHAEFTPDISSMSIDPAFTILMPSIRSSERMHREANVLFRGFGNKKEFYTTGVTRNATRLSDEVVREKLRALDFVVPDWGIQDSNTDSIRYEHHSATDLEMSVEVSFQFEGIHSYPDAPEGVEYLRYPHRHMFHIKVELEVFHDDREVEFILLKRELERMVHDNFEALQHKSCEMIGQVITEYVIQKYTRRDCTVKVFEDAENGAIVRYRY